MVERGFLDPLCETASQHPSQEAVRGRHCGVPQSTHVFQTSDQNDDADNDDEVREMAFLSARNKRRPSLMPLRRTLFS